MPNRPGRPRGGPPMAQRLAHYLQLRERGLTYEQAAEAMDVSREAICQYVRKLKEIGQLPPLPPHRRRLAPAVQDTTTINPHTPFLSKD